MTSISHFELTRVSQQQKHNTPVNKFIKKTIDMYLEKLLINNHDVYIYSVNEETRSRQYWEIMNEFQGKCNLRLPR